MKKHLTSILLLLLPAVLIIYAPQAVRGASAGLVLWFNQVLPVFKCLDRYGCSHWKTA